MGNKKHCFFAIEEACKTRKPDCQKGSLLKSLSDRIWQSKPAQQAKISTNLTYFVEIFAFMGFVIGRMGVFSETPHP